MGRRKSRSRPAVADTAEGRSKTKTERPRAQHGRAAAPARAAHHGKPPRPSHSANSRKPVTRPALDVTRDVALDMTLDAAPNVLQDLAHDAAPIAPLSLLPTVEWSAPPDNEPAAEPVATPSLVPNVVPVTEPDIAPFLPEPPPQPAKQTRPRSPRDILAVALTVVAMMIVGAGWLAVYIKMVPPPVPVTLVKPPAPPPPSKEFTERLAPPAKATGKIIDKSIDTTVDKAAPIIVLPRAAEPLPPPEKPKTARANAKRHKTRN